MKKKIFGQGADGPQKTQIEGFGRKPAGQIDNEAFVRMQHGPDQNLFPVFERQPALVLRGINMICSRHHIHILTAYSLRVYSLIASSCGKFSDIETIFSSLVSRLKSQRLKIRIMA